MIEPIVKAIRPSRYSHVVDVGGDSSKNIGNSHSKRDLAEKRAEILARMEEEARQCAEKYGISLAKARKVIGGQITLIPTVKKARGIPFINGALVHLRSTNVL